MSHKIAPSLLAADFGNLQRDIEMVNQSSADWFHLDIMDGVFVPNISYGMPVMEAIQKHANLPLDVHLMIVEPDKYISTFKNLGAKVLTVHYEVCKHLHRTIYAIKEEGMLAGVALNPHTPVSVLKDVINDIDLVLIMSVNPGFGGQAFIPESYDRIKQLRKMIDESGYQVKIEVDGGVNMHNAADIIKAGADILVAGSSIFKSENPVATIESMKRS